MSRLARSLLRPRAVRAGCRPRVLHVVDSLSVGGTERVLLRLISATAERFDHFIGCIRDLGGREQAFEAAGAGVTLIGKREGQDWGVPWRIARLCRALRPDVVHSRNWGAIDGIVAARLVRVPIVIYAEHGSDGDASSLRRRARVRRLLFPFVDRIVAVSKHLERWLVEEIGAPGDRVAVIPNGVDATWFRAAADRDRRRRELGYGPEQVLFGAVGRLQAIKNHARLLCAFDALHRERREARLVVVGEGPERASLAREIERRGLRGVVRLAGEQQDVRGWLTAMDVFVQPSLMEGMSNAILEAMSVGLPVVATRVGGNPEVVDDGVTGRLVDPADTVGLVERLRAYGDSAATRAAHGRAGRQKVLRAHSEERMVRAYADLYDGALGRRASDAAATRPALV